MLDKWDLIIIGGGPSGLAAAQYGARANLKTLLLEKQNLGGQTLLIDNLENYPYLTNETSGYDFIEKLVEQSTNFGAQIDYQEVTEVKKVDNDFFVTTAKGVLTAKSVIIATGAKHRHISVDGEDRLAGKGVSYCATCDGPFFRNKKIVVVGGGDAACDEAMFLSKLTDTVTIIHRKDRFRAQKAVADRVLANSKIKTIFNSGIEKINGENKVESILVKNYITGESKELEADAVFIFVGTIPVTEFLDESVKRDSAGYIETNDKMQTNILGLFCVGDVRTTPFRQVVTACADGAIAAHSASEYIDELNNNKYL